MKQETIERALKCLPATREQLAARLDCEYNWASKVAKYLIKEKHAQEWGRELTQTGVLRPVLHAL